MNIYVGNLSAKTTEWQLRKAFEMYGKVDAITLATKPNDATSFTFCFVEMPFEKQATLAIEKLHETVLSGNVVTVKASGVTA